jgi:hypothetical protein
LVYEKNKHNTDIIEKINFPSIQKRETAKYIFEFINYLTHRVQNNSITPFGRLDDIKSHLVSQWSFLFQRLLSENRTRSLEVKRYMDFSERLDDLKAVVLASISEGNMRDLAKGAIQFRHLIAFVSALDIPDHHSVLLSDVSWENLLLEAKIVDVKFSEELEGGLRGMFYLIVEDQTFYRCRFPRRHYENLRADWALFARSKPDTRTAITDALLEDRDYSRSREVRWMGMTLDEYLLDSGPSALKRATFSWSNGVVSDIG